jgi:hypothetical protein
MNRTPLAFALLCATVSVTTLHAAPISVKHSQGTQHGFLALRSESGELIGRGDLIQWSRGDRVTTELVLHFRDGSLDDEISTFTQAGTFRLLSDHHVQKGPFFSKQLDMTVDGNGNVVVHTTEKNGKEKVDTEHIDLPADDINGMILPLFTNLTPHAAEEVSLVVPVLDKGRLIKLAIDPEGPQHFSDVGHTESADIFRVHMNLGGIVGAVAPMIGKQPPDLFIWVAEGPAPQVVRLFGPLAEDTPPVSIELSGAVFKHVAAGK